MLLVCLRTKVTVRIGICFPAGLPRPRSLLAVSSTQVPEKSGFPCANTRVVIATAKTRERTKGRFIVPPICIFQNTHSVIFGLSGHSIVDLSGFFNITFNPDDTMLFFRDSKGSFFFFNPKIYALSCDTHGFITTIRSLACQSGTVKMVFEEAVLNLLGHFCRPDERAQTRVSPVRPSHWENLFLKDQHNMILYLRNAWRRPGSPFHLLPLSP